MKFLFLLIFLVSCYSRHYGYNFEDNQMCTGKTGETTKQDIVDLFGHPTIINENKLIYISRQDTQVTFIRHIFPKQQSCIFTFNKKDILKSVEYK